MEGKETGRKEISTDFLSRKQWNCVLTHIISIQYAKCVSGVSVVSGAKSKKKTNTIALCFFPNVASLQSCSQKSESLQSDFRIAYTSPESLWVQSDLFRYMSSYEKSHVETLLTRALSPLWPQDRILCAVGVESPQDETGKPYLYRFAVLSLPSFTQEKRKWNQCPLAEKIKREEATNESKEQQSESFSLDNGWLKLYWLTQRIFEPIVSFKRAENGKKVALLNHRMDTIVQLPCDIDYILLQNKQEQKRLFLSSKEFFCAYGNLVEEVTCRTYRFPPQSPESAFSFSTLLIFPLHIQILKSRPIPKPFSFLFKATCSFFCKSDLSISKEKEAFSIQLAFSMPFTTSPSPFS